LFIDLATSGTPAESHPQNQLNNQGDKFMLLVLALVLLVLWFLGFLAFHVTSAAIHIILGLAIVIFLWHLVSRQRTAV